MVDCSGYSESEIELWFYNYSGLPDHKFERKDPSVKDRPCTSEFSSEQRGEFSIPRKGIRSFDTAPYADDYFRIGNVETVIRFVRSKGENFRSDLIRRKINSFPDDLRLSPTGRLVFESTGTDCADLRTHERNGDNSHHFSAHSRFNEFNVSAFRVINKLCCIRCTAGRQPAGKPRRKVSAVDGPADKNSGRSIFPAQNGKQMCIGIHVKGLITCARHDDQLIDSGVKNFIQFTLGKTGNNDCCKFFTGGITELSDLRAEFQRDRLDRLAVMFDIDPHVSVVCFVHGILLYKTSFNREKSLSTSFSGLPS